MSDQIRMLYDPELRRPGCVLLQAVAGGDRRALDIYFSSENWLIAPTPDMKMFSGTHEQWKQIATLTPRSERTEE